METPRSKSQASANRGVRIVGKIRPFVDSESRSSSQSYSQISISRSDGEHATICFGDQSNGKKDCYKLDWCYEKEEDITEVFCKEVKPLLLGVLKGTNGCVIAHGARGSGKTHLIQGSGEVPGLAKMAISEIFPAIDELGGSVSISCYEVCQDRVYDLLETKEKEVLIMEDAKRRIQLKGLSKVPVKSIPDFMKSYFQACKERTFLEKGADDVASRTHKGLIIHVSYVDKESKKSLEGKMNFVDLAGYEDTKMKSSSKASLNEIARVNKSIYALLNVIYALNSGETYIPYRETKLTRLLQDSLCSPSGAVLFTCMNPTACQDTIHSVCLASRSCYVVNHYNSAKNNKSGSRFVPSSSPMNGMIRALNASVKKLDIAQLDSAEKKGYGTSSTIKKSKPQTLSNLKTNVGSSVSTVKKVNELPTTMRSFRTMSSLESPTISHEKVLYSLHTQNVPVGDEQHNLSKANHTEQVVCHENYEIQEVLDIGLVKLDNDNHDDTKEKYSQIPILEVGQRSPTLTEQLREISNSLKFVSSKPISVSTTVDNSCKRHVTMDSMEPKTPRTPFHLRFNGDSRFEDMGTPQDILKARSTGLKKSLVQECLTFLNSASKEELKELKGIGEKRAAYIIKLREETPEPFKEIDDLKDIGISSKQIKGMMSHLLGNF